MTHPARRLALVVAVGSLLAAVGVGGPAEGAAKKKTTTTTKKAASKSSAAVKRTTTTSKRSRSVVSSSTTSPTTLPPIVTVATAAPVPTAPPLPAPTPAPTTTPTTTPPADDFNIRVVQPAKQVAPGEIASFVVIVEPKGSRLVPVTVLVSGMTGGMVVSLDPNPITTAAELRILVPPTMPPGFYDLRVNGTGGAFSHSAAVTLLVGSPVGAATTTSTSTTTSTTLPPGNPGFTISVLAPSDKLRNGGTISFPINLRSVNGFGGAVLLSTAGLPAGVWGGFSDNPMTATSTLWLSASVPLVPGNYSFSLVATYGTYTMLVPLQVTLI